MDRRRFLEAGVLGGLALRGDPLDACATLDAFQHQLSSAESGDIQQVFKLAEHYDPGVVKDAYLKPKRRGGAAPPHRVLFYDTDRKVFLPPALLKDNSSVLNQTGTFTMEVYLRRYHTSAALDNPLKQQFDAGSLQLQLGATNVNSDGSDDLTWLLITGLVLPQAHGESILNDNNPTSKFANKIEVRDGVLGFSVSLWGQKKQGSWFKWLNWVAGVLKTTSNFALFGVIPLPALPRQAVQVVSNALNYLQTKEKLYEIWNSLQGRYAILNSIPDSQVEGYLPQGTYILLDSDYYNKHRDMPNRRFLVGHTVDIDSGAYSLLDQSGSEPDAADYLAVRLTYQKKA